jgi:phosphocarrier protein FPr
VTLRAAGGVEVLMHIGIDTVALKGAGFTPRVKAGDRVQTGTPLIDFDLDYVATHAKSLLTQVIISNGDTVGAMKSATGAVRASSDTLLTLTLAAGGTAVVTGEGALVTSDAILIPNPTGLHARPAAVLASVAKTFQSEIKLQIDERTANARSITGIMGLEAARGDKIVIVARGADARQVVEKLSKLIAEGLGDEGCSPAPALATIAVAKIAEPAPRPRSADPNVLLGVAASPGLAVGKAIQVARQDIPVEEQGRGVEREKQALAEAIDKARGQLDALRAQLHAKADPAKAAIFAAHAELLDDPDFLDIANSAIAKGKSAAFAWKNATKLHAERLAALRNELLAQRANDVRDVGWRVLELLTGTKRQKPTVRYHHNGARTSRRFCHGARWRHLARRHSRAFAGYPRHCGH